MLPTIPSHSITVIEKPMYQNADLFDHIHVGDIIVYTTATGEEFYGKNPDKNGCLPGNKIGHRVVDIQFDSQGEKYLIAKGDNNTISEPILDYPIYENQLIGRVIRFYAPIP